MKELPKDKDLAEEMMQAAVEAIFQEMDLQG